jgi:eukaryotic-like serine/threonine-protein kinase
MLPTSIIRPMSRASAGAKQSQATRSWVRVRELAAGGMGRVDLVLRRGGSFERLYAVKRLHPHLREDTEAERMFLDEARIAGLIRHPNVVSVHEVGEDEDGSFLLMDYVEGIPLNRFLREHKMREELPPLVLCMQIAVQIAHGLHAAHTLTDSHGQHLHIVHRDVSPQNILLGFDGLARLTDFGVARAIGRSSHTAAGVLKGKLRYMSPEQLRFEELDFRSDLYSFGVVLYELVTTEHLAGDRSAEALARATLLEPPPDPGEARADLPPALIELMFELLAKSPDARPSSAKEVADRLESIRVELLAEDPAPPDLGAYLERWFGDERTRLRDETQARVRSLAQAGPGHGAAGTAYDEPSTIASAETPSQTNVRRRPLRTTLALAIVDGSS